MNIHRQMQERFDLAATYARDGAFHSAARILGELATSVKGHAQWRADCLAEMMARVPEEECPGHIASAIDPARKGVLEAQHRDGFTPHGSGPVPIEPHCGTVDGSGCDL